ncbi:MAG: MBL fold metallo-hydrolase, partial [Actinomycetota bacterium]|nr:MBL fold metallo-hydrolase [Actinomycetota bacterium]
MLSVFDELADGVFRRRYESLDINIGVILSDDGVLVIDTRCTHAEADELRDDLRKLTPLPVRWVVDTHWHWDHTFGNSRFPEAEIWGHDRCRTEMVERGESMKDDAAEWLPDQRDEFRTVVITPPTELFSEHAQVDMGSKIVSLSYHGLGHTNADIVISVEDDDVIFMGDLVEDGAPPVFDDGYPISWPQTLKSVLADGTTLIVPGHGDTMSRAVALGQLEEIGIVAGLARQCIEESLPVAEAARLGPY